MDQPLLFSDREMAAPVAPSFVFPTSREELLELTTSIEIDSFLDAAMFRCGFAGGEKARTVAIQTVREEILTRFITDGEFAARLGATDDARTELWSIVHGFLVAHGLSSKRHL